MCAGHGESSLPNSENAVLLNPLTSANAHTSPNVGSGQQISSDGDVELGSQATTFAIRSLFIQGSFDRHAAHHCLHPK